MKNDKINLLKNRNSTMKWCALNNNKINDSGNIISFSKYKRKRNYKNKSIFTNGKNSPSVKKAYVVVLYSILLALVGLLVIFKLLDINRTSDASSKNALSNSFASENILLSNSEKDSYNYIISATLTKKIGLTSKDTLKVTDLHKNGSFVYTHGFFALDKNHNKIYFDLIFHNKKPYSLLINGNDLMK